MNWLRNVLLPIAGVVALTCVLAAHYYYKGFYKAGAAYAHTPFPHGMNAGETTRITQKALMLKKFLVQEKFNTNIAFLVDMQLPSGKNRFFVYDLLKDSILQAGLVAHGCGNSKFSFSPSFSNTDGSNCSALGRYRIGGAYMGHFGRSYLLYGLDPTNDHALDRHIVLHSYGCVPEGETDPYPICNSQGCAMISPGFLKGLEPVIDHTGRPILLWIFN